MNFFENIPYQGFFAIYLIIAMNFTGELFGCKLRQILEENMLAKHFFAFLTFTFVVILTSVDISNYKNFIKAVLYSIIFYIWFVLTTRTHIYITIIVLIIFFIMYVLTLRVKELKKKSDEKSVKEFKKIKNVNSILLIIAFIITIIGVMNYIALRKKEWKNSPTGFNFFTFFTGKAKCRNYAWESVMSF